MQTMSDKTNKDQRWTVRLTGEEFAQLEKIAQDDGHENPAPWLRRLIADLKSGKAKIVRSK